MSDVPHRDPEHGFWRKADDDDHIFGRGRFIAVAVWAAFIVAPPVNAIGESGSGPSHIAVIAAAFAFAVLYAWLAFSWQPECERPRRSLVLASGLLALAIALVAGDGPTWGYLFTYCGACTALAIPTRWGFAAITAIAGLGAAVTALAGGGGSDVAGIAISTVGVGLIMVLMRGVRVRNAELMTARAELARTAVIAERERFARDLHDLLGHTLSVITIKTELAGRLLPGRPEQAAAEIAEVERVARQALGEVREAVSGYRRPTLTGEMEGARVALSAAGIDVSFERPHVVLDPEVEAVLAWAVREGATNVIRHSGARHCQVRVVAGAADAAVEVVDDGRGQMAIRTEDAAAGSGLGSALGSAEGPAGNGLAGLTERAERLRGRLEAGALPGGGFRLAVSVPNAALAP